jgi:hypothetical protein
MTLSLEEQMRIAAGYSEREGGEPETVKEEVKPTPVTQTTVTTEYVTPATVEQKEEPKINANVETPQKIEMSEKEVNNNFNTKEIIINALKVYERYSELTEPEKSVVIQFVNAEPSNDVPTIIEKIISVDSHKRESLINFVAILQKDEVKRAFCLMSFNQNQLESLDEIASRFISDYKQIPYSENKKIEYAENLNDNLRKLPEKALTLLERLEEVLNY